MPRRVRPKRQGEAGKAWKIIEPGGKVVGESDTRKKAQASARAANEAKS